VTPLKAVFVFIVAVIAMMLFAAATQNWFLTRSKLWENVALLLIAFTLFNPGYWLNHVAAPYDFVASSNISQIADEAPDDAVIRVRMEGEDFTTGEIVTTTVQLPLGAMSTGDGVTRLERNAGIAFRTEDDGKVYVDNVIFGQFAQDKGVDFDWEVLRIEEPADRMPKEVFYIPALLLLAFIAWLQLGRARKLEAQTA